MMDNAAIVKALVKPLVWEDRWSGGDEDIPSWRAKQTLGLLVSVSFAGKYKLKRHADAPPEELAERKTKAEADYQARISAALHIDKIAALVEAGVAAEVQLRECGVKMVGPGASALADLRDALAAFRGTEDGAAP